MTSAYVLAALGLLCVISVNAVANPAIAKQIANLPANPAPIGGAQKDSYNGWGYDNVYDKNYDSDVNKNGCYHSAGPYIDGSWVEVHLDGQYVVHFVGILNRDCCMHHQIGMVVKVCTGGKCAQCGTVESAENSKSSYVRCETGLIGDTVRFENDDYIQICEAFFTAFKIGTIVPIGGDQRDALNGWGYKSLYDGGLSTDVNHNQCYHSATEPNPWVSLHLDTFYTVTEVRILNRGDCCGERTIGMEVNICTYGSQNPENCHPCGTVLNQWNTAVDGAWVTLECAPGATGNSVKLESHNVAINICEVVIKGAPFGS